MTKKMTITEFKTWAKRRGWVEDNWSHLQKTVGDKQYRFKVSSTAVRYEVKVIHAPSQYSRGSSEWVRLRSGYFKDLSFGADDKLKGLR